MTVGRDLVSGLQGIRQSVAQLQRAGPVTARKVSQLCKATLAQLCFKGLCLLMLCQGSAVPAAINQAES